MTNVCNVFRPLQSKIGNFLLFSQYVEDLSRSTVDDGYNVIPSKFVCLNLTATDINNIVFAINNVDMLASQEDSFNGVIPQIFQNSFENSISIAKNQFGSEFEKHNFATNFWWHMGYFLGEYENVFNLNEKIKYVKDIDLLTWKDGFADLILNIPSGSSEQQWIVNTDTDPSRVWDSVEGFCNDCGMTALSFNNFIEGWKSEELTESDIVNGALNEGSYDFGLGALGETQSTVDNKEDSVFENMFIQDSKYAPTEESFDFNTIIVLYDVKEGESEYKDVPMGIFFTGDIDDSGNIGNPVTIYSSNEDAYGAGTGWSLRISTKFSNTPQGLLKVEEVAVDSKVLESSLSAQLSAVAELIKTVRGNFAENMKISNDLKNQINEYSNIVKTNIPYIVDGYWWVNGVNTGQKTYNNLGVDECSREQIDSLFE